MGEEEDEDDFSFAVNVLDSTGRKCHRFLVSSQSAACLKGMLNMEYCVFQWKCHSTNTTSCSHSVVALRELMKGSCETNQGRILV